MHKSVLEPFNSQGRLLSGDLTLLGFELSEVFERFETTGTLDAGTSAQLAISSSKSSMGSRDDMRSNGNTTRGKDTHQPNLPAQNN